MRRRLINHIRNTAPLGYWDISTASYVQSFGTTNTPRDVRFSTDGTKMYIGDSDAPATLYEYALSTAWNLSTVSLTRSTTYLHTAPSGGNTFEGFHFSPDGTRFYTANNVQSKINQYDLSTAWDISTVSYVRQFDTSAKDANPVGLAFNPTGTKMYFIGYANDKVYQYDLSTAWDISTTSFVQDFSIASQTGLGLSLFFKEDGTQFFITDYFGVRVCSYNVSTAWDISTASFDKQKDVSAQVTIARGVAIGNSGAKMYVIDDGTYSLYEYNL
jgi:sugar lactone lactonase YvrE